MIQVKMRSLGQALIQYDSVLRRGGKFGHRDTDTQRERHVMTQRDTGVTAASQGAARIDGHHQKLTRGKEGFPYRLQRQHGSENTLISDFWPPEP